MDMLETGHVTDVYGMVLQGHVKNMPMTCYGHNINMLRYVGNLKYDGKYLF